MKRIFLFLAASFLTACGNSNQFSSHDGQPAPAPAGDSRGEASISDSSVQPMSTAPRYVTKAGCASGYACVAWQNYYVLDGVSPFQSPSCVEARGNEVKVYMWTADYNQIWVTPPYYSDNANLSGGAHSAAERRADSLCSHQVPAP